MQIGQPDRYDYVAGTELSTIVTGLNVGWVEFRMWSRNASPYKDEWFATLEADVTGLAAPDGVNIEWDNSF